MIQLHLDLGPTIVFPIKLVPLLVSRHNATQLHQRDWCSSQIKEFSTFFLSLPNRLVHAYFPVLLLCAGFLCSHTTRFNAEISQGTPLASGALFSKSSSLSQSTTSVMMLSNSTSVSHMMSHDPGEYLGKACVGNSS